MPERVAEESVLRIYQNLFDELDKIIPYPVYTFYLLKTIDLLPMVSGDYGGGPSLNI